MRHIGDTQKGLELVNKLASLGGEIKVTKITKTGFNEMEGNTYMVRVKAIAPAGKVWTSNRRKSLLFGFDTNSTWGEPEEYNDEDEKDLIKELVYSACL